VSSRGMQAMHFVISAIDLVKLPCVLITEKPVSPKSGALKSPPKGFDTTAINKSYYNVVSDCRAFHKWLLLLECL
jgi:hypothetical protein